jgi:hypothetical protein
LSVRLPVAKNNVQGVKPMSFTRAHFIRHKPWLYHFTHLDNVDVLRRETAMLSAAAWVARANAFEPGQVPNPHAFLSEPRLARAA